MNNKIFGTTFAALLGSTVLFFGVSQAGTYVINEVVFPQKGFGDQTYIGPFNVSNLPENEAAVTVRTGVQGWYDQAQVQIQLQEVVVPFPLEAVQFNTDQTINSAQDGEKNKLHFEVQEESVGSFLNQQFSPIVFSEEDISAVTDYMKQQLVAGRNHKIIDISNILFEQLSLNETVTSVTFDNVDSSVGIQHIMAALDGYVVERLSTFSLLDFIETVDVGVVTDQDLTTVASLIYASILQTNFGVDERSIGPFVPTTVPLGFEASINQKIGVDFAFTNPNSTPFTLKLTKAGNGLEASFTGFPLVYRYETSMSELEEFSPKTIKQFSSFVEQNSIRIKSEGVNGVQLTVYKHILSGDNVIETIEVSKDFYPPVHKVEIHSLSASTTSGENGTDTDTTTDGTSDWNPDGSSNGGTGQPSTGNGDSTEDSDTSSEGTTGTNTDSRDEEELQYDKGGNSLPPSK